ncbi:MAG: YabP/YqfC family sporulation protein [Anaeroplasmataceae bacterium]|jgi:YabP family.|nr:YabP/YqfC family sporulation protein [Anaeroplasmataceae bacterium]HRF70256.1 YabP/YqfC family sporulation protein [Candidatus Pelethenecus sp.]
MASANFTIYDDYILINNITEIKEFSEQIFVLKINDIPYEITGSNLVLKEVSNDNRSIKITGIVDSVNKKNVQVKKNKGFIKKLFA